MKRAKYLCLFACTAVLVPHAWAWQMKRGPLATPWSMQIDTNTPWPEYLRPQLVRTDWLNLNGLWQSQAGEAHAAVPSGKELTDTILVPFPMESPNSGIMAYHPNSLYRRTFTVPPALQ